MSSWFRFLKQHFSVLTFGFLLNFFSGYGQTFLISLYLVYIVQEFSITNTFFGVLYALATLSSAFLLTFLGRYIDSVRLKNYSMLSVLLLVSATLSFAFSTSLPILFISILGVRLGGQGLMSHISATSVAKYFTLDRGKALGITSLGHPAGQFILPLLFLPIIQSLGWRSSLVISGIIAAIILPSIILWSSKNFSEQETAHITTEQKPVKQSELIRTSTFWLVATNSFVIPFLATALFLYQIPIGESKGWSLEWIAFSFTFFAVFNSLAMLWAGTLIDRFTALKLFPLYLLPIFVGIMMMGFIDSTWVGPVYMGLMGFSVGLGTPIKVAIQSELYGVRYLGTVRSLFSSLLVFSTALGPPIYGFFLDIGISYNALLVGSSLLVLISILISFLLWPKRLRLQIKNTYLTTKRFYTSK